MYSLQNRPNDVHKVSPTEELIQVVKLLISEQQQTQLDHLGWSFPLMPHVPGDVVVGCINSEDAFMLSTFLIFSLIFQQLTRCYRRSFE